MARQPSALGFMSPASANKFLSLALRLRGDQTAENTTDSGSSGIERKVGRF
jgi:hypothetical protein